MMYVIKKEKGTVGSLPAREIAPAQAKAMTSELAQKILRVLAKEPGYPKDIARKLSVHEQKVYYHVRQMERSGLIKVVRREDVGGTVAKYYALSDPAFVIRFSEFRKARDAGSLKAEAAGFLSPFIKDGRLDASIVVGSPDPHGPEKSRSRDGYCAIDLALFLGTFLEELPSPAVRLDTEITQKELEGNMILIGGPIVNKVTARVNPKLVIRFDSRSNWDIISSLTGKSYSQDESGLLVKSKNPFNPEKSLLLVAGKRYSGTKAAMLAFLNRFDELCRGNSANPKVFARVVEGIDADSDGKIDDVEFRE